MQNESSVGRKVAKLKWPKLSDGEGKVTHPDPHPKIYLQNATLWGILNGCANFQLDRTKTVDCGNDRLNTVSDRKKQSQPYWFRPATPRNGHGWHLYRSNGDGARTVSTPNCFVPSLTLLQIFPQTPLSARIWKQTGVRPAFRAGASMKLMKLGGGGAMAHKPANQCHYT